jgi:predicted small secreted protein
MTKENLNTLGVILAAGLGIILVHWLTYYIEEKYKIAPYTPIEEVKTLPAFPAEEGKDKG